MAQAGCRVSESPGLRLAKRFLSELIQRAPGPLRLSRMEGAIAPAVEQDSGRGPPTSGRAVHAGPRGAGGAAHIARKDEESQEGPARRMTRLDGRMGSS